MWHRDTASDPRARILEYARTRSYREGKILLRLPDVSEEKGTHRARSEGPQRGKVSRAFARRIQKLLVNSNR